MIRNANITSADEPAPTPTPAPATQTPPANADSARESSGPATATKPAQPAIEQLPPYRVLLHNDDQNAHDEVVDALVELTPLNKPRAIEVMLEAEARGLSLVLMTHKERAELYEQQLRSKKLVVTIEPAV